MSSQLLTIEGVYDGKTIQPLEAVKTDKKQRVLITFLEELLPLDDSGSNGNRDLSELDGQLQALAEKAGVADWKRFVMEVLREKAQAAKNKAFVYAVSGEIQAGMQRAGIGEKDVLNDFDDFRRKLPRE